MGAIGAAELFQIALITIALIVIIRKVVNFLRPTGTQDKQ